MSGFDFDGADLEQVVVNFQVRLWFNGSREIVFTTPLVLHRGDDLIELDPEDRATVGPVLALYPDVALEVSVSNASVLTVRFRSGASITAQPHPMHEAWEVLSSD